MKCTSFVFVRMLQSQIPLLKLKSLIGLLNHEAYVMSRGGTAQNLLVPDDAARFQNESR